MRHSFKIALTIFLLGLVGASVWGLFHLKPQENIQGLIPNVLREKVELFEHSPLNRKIFAVVVAPDEDTSREYAQELKNFLVQKELISVGFIPSPQIAQSLVKALPFHFAQQDQLALEEKITPGAIQKSIQEDYEKLVSFEGFLMKPLVQLDPLRFIDLMAHKLALLNPQTHSRYEDGFLTAQEGTVRVGIYEMVGAANFPYAQKMQRAFAEFSGKLPAGVQAFFLGGLRYTAENVTAIKHDLWKVGCLAFVSLALIFAIFLRDKQALLIYLLPVAVTPLAALITYTVFGRISGITLGFGSVVAGLSVDYAVYVFFALRAKKDLTVIRKHLRKHLCITFITSSLCFTALFISSVEVFHQIAVFAISGLLLSLLAALYIFPLYWTDLTPAKTPFLFHATRFYLTKKTAIITSILVVLLGICGLKYTHFSGDLQTLNTTSSQFTSQRNILQNVLNGTEQEQALVFVKGNTQEEALANNEQFAKQLSFPLATAVLFPSQSSVEKNLERWKSFWTFQKRADIQNNIQQEAQSLKIAPKAFTPFFDFLVDLAPQAAFDFSQIYNPIIALSNGTWAVVNVVPNTAEVDTAARRAKSILIAGSSLQRELLSAIKKEAAQIVCWALIWNLFMVSLMFRSIKKALLAFIPVVLAASFTFACFWIFKVEINLFVLIFLPFLIGLGIDYGVFQLIRAETDIQTQEAYPPQALWTAALSTLAGFGVLIFARHGVLFIIGLSSFLGVGSAALGAQWILPALIEENKIK